MKKIILSIITVVVFFFSANAQVLDRSKLPQPGPAPKIQIGNYDSFVLENGMKVFVVENHKLPKVSYSLVLDYDPTLEGENAGYVGSMGQLLRTGTANRTKDQLDEEIDFIGASLNTSESGIYSSCLKKHNEKLLELMSDILINAQFKQEELDKIIKQTISGLASQKNEPSAIAQKVSAALMYSKDHPYGESVNEASASKVTLEMCKKFYQTYFRPNIAYMAIVGDITTAEAKPLMEKYFGKWQKADVPKKQYNTPMNPSVTSVAIVDRPNAVQSLFEICYPVELRPGGEDAIKARVMNTILGGGTFRLFTNLREKHSYTYGAYSSLSADKLIGNFNASANVRNSVTDSAITEVILEMNKLRTEKVPVEELTMVKNYLSGTFALSLENAQTVANFALNIERYNLPKDYYANYMKNIEAVNDEDVLAMAQKYLKPDNAYILAVGKAEEIADKLKKFSREGKINYYDTDGNLLDLTVKLKEAPNGMTADAVLKKYVEVIGGEKNLLKIKDMQMKMTTSMQGMTVNFETFKKAPNKSKMVVGANGMIFQTVIFDGVKGVVSSMQEGEKEMKDKELEEMKLQSVMNMEMNYAQYGIKYNLLGIEVLNGKDNYKLEQVMPSGEKSTEYYSVETGFKTRSVEKQSVTDFDNYKEVDGGIKVPYTISQDLGEQSLKLEVVSVLINKKMKDSVFEIKK
ncbi:MAG: insulinase family protein [Bacteroidetes bacterium]|nr:insulinase family protein [Bacteroidota bacterium]